MTAPTKVYAPVVVRVVVFIVIHDKVHVAMVRSVLLITETTDPLMNESQLTESPFLVHNAMGLASSCNWQIVMHA